jgi:hypothetical protein
MTGARDRWATSPAAYVGRPQVWSQHFFYDSQHGGSAASQAVDIVMNDTDVIPRAGADPRLVRLEQGILDTLVEHVLSATPDGLNTWDRFAGRGAEGVAWTVLRPGTDPEPGLADALPSADLARMRAALAHGDTVVVATEPRLNGAVPFAEWWRISKDGTALGIGDRGWGSEFGEYDAITKPSQSTLRALELERDAIRVEQELARIRATAQNMREQGRLYDATQHLYKSGNVDALMDTLPIIARLGF